MSLGILNLMADVIWDLYSFLRKVCLNCLWSVFVLKPSPLGFGYQVVSGDKKVFGCKMCHSVSFFLFFLFCGVHLFLLLHESCS